MECWNTITESLNLESLFTCFHGSSSVMNTVLPVRTAFTLWETEYSVALTHRSHQGAHPSNYVLRTSYQSNKKICFKIISSWAHRKSKSAYTGRQDYDNSLRPLFLGKSVGPSRHISFPLITMLAGMRYNKLSLWNQNPFISYPI